MRTVSEADEPGVFTGDAVYVGTGAVPREKVGTEVATPPAVEVADAE